jgi:hypothetical protein
MLNDCRNRYQVKQKNARYKWKAVACGTSHNVMCSLREPRCPRGFTWLPEFMSYACFKVSPSPTGLTFTSPSGSLEVANSQFSSEKYCNVLGTRLATPKDTLDTETISTWLKDQSQITKIVGSNLSIPSIYIRYP